MHLEFFSEIIVSKCYSYSYDSCSSWFDINRNIKTLFDGHAVCTCSVHQHDQKTAKTKLPTGQVFRKVGYIPTLISTYNVVMKKKL